MKLPAVVLTLLLALAPSVVKAQATPQQIQHLSGAVAVLYVQTDDGGQKMLCTATAYRKTDIVPAAAVPQALYRFVSAAHCVDGDDDAEQKANQKFFVTSDNTGTKTFIPAILLEAGDKAAGDDFSIFEVTATETTFTVVPLGDDRKLTLGEPVINIAAPLGLGKQYFSGYISTGLLDRPKMDAGEVSWHDVYLAAIGGGPGSSGSSIISVKQDAIVGFFVGSFTRGQVGHIVIPVSQFEAFEKKVDAKTYKKAPGKPKFGLQLLG